MLKVPRRILVVSEPGRDGVFRHVQELVCGYVQAGCTVGFVYSSIRGSRELDQFVDSLRERGSFAIDLGISSHPSWRDLRALWLLWVAVKNFAPDVIHAHSSKAGLLARGLWFLGRNPGMIYTPHAYYNMSRRGSILDSPFWFAEAFLSRFGYTVNVGNAERVFALQTLGIQPGRAWTVQNWVDLQSIRPRARRDEAIFQFGSVARFAPQKDPLPLYRALRRFIARHKDVCWYHVGDGALLFDASPKEVPGMTIRPKFDDRERFYQSLDVFVLTSRFEGLPISVLEAMAANLPLVLTRVPGLAEFEQYGLNSIFWCSAGDDVSIEDALVRARAYCATRTWQCNHREMAIRHFGIEVVRGRLLATIFDATADQALTV